jgi:hypothetical protein
MRVNPEALLLTAATTWLINSLHARPDDGPASRSLMESVLPLTDAQDADHLALIFYSRRGDGNEEEEDGEDGEELVSVPYLPFGAFFLRRIMVLEVPRMRSGGPMLTAAAFKFIFGRTMVELRHDYLKPGIIPLEVMSANRVVTNKTKRTPMYIPEPGTTQPVLFNLAEKNLALPPPAAVDSGSDWESDEDRGEDSSLGIDETVTQLYRQFIIDMFNKSPNPRGPGKASYCLLSRSDKLTASEDLFKNLHVPDIWRACQFKVGTDDEFSRAFGHLFPEREHETSPNVQGYLQCQYYMKWKDLSSTAPPDTFDAIRRSIKRRVSKFVWLPDAQQDKIWPTTHIAHFQQYPPDSPSNAPAPRLLFRRPPEW